MGDLSITDYGAFGAGDATLHAGYTVHGSGANRSGAARYALAVAYVADGTRVAEPADDQQALAIALHAPGVGTGDVIATEANPVVWPVEAA
jgi:ectoine hydroxylase-related dioxygenase (phytanoyl-CoA dioxygenase family)